MLSFLSFMQKLSAYHALKKESILLLGIRKTVFEK